jgi:hypothetical protein
MTELLRKSRRNPETQANIDHINNLYNRGIDQIHRSHLPHPNRVARAIAADESKAFALTPSGEILIATNNKVVR